MSFFPRHIFHRLVFPKGWSRRALEIPLPGFGLALYSTVPKFWIHEAGPGQSETKTPFGKGSPFAHLASCASGIAFLEAIRAVCGDKKDETKCGDQCEESICLHKMDQEELVIEKANMDLEKALKDVKPKAMEAVEKAIKAYCEASLIVKEFMDKAYCAIDQDQLESPEFEETWCDVYDFSLKRCEKVKDAVNKGHCAWELLCKLREVIENGKNCKYTACHPLLVTSEETLLCAETELLNARAKMECVQSDSVLVAQYWELIQRFRSDLQAESECAPVDDCTGNECVKITTLAYKKAMRIQKEVAMIQVGMGKVPCKQAETLC